MTVIRINEESLRAAAIEYIEACDRLQCHIHLRLKPNGECYVDEDAGFCISADEFNRAPGAPKTLRHRQGDGQQQLPDNWTECTEAQDEIDNFIESILEDLKQEKYTVEFTDIVSVNENPKENIEKRYKLDTENSGCDEVLTGESIESATQDVLNRYDLEDLPPGWTITEITDDGDDTYRFENGKLYKLIDGAYRHVLSSPYADTREKAIATFESMRANDTDFLPAQNLSQ